MCSPGLPSLHLHILHSTIPSLHPTCSNSFHCVAHEVVLADLSLLSSCVNNYRSFTFAKTGTWLGGSSLDCLTIFRTCSIVYAASVSGFGTQSESASTFSNVLLLLISLASQLSCLTGQIPDVITVCLAENAVRNQYYKSCPLKQHESNHAKQLSPTNNTSNHAKQLSPTNNTRATTQKKCGSCWSNNNGRITKKTAK
jgi:hypothetical protein